MEKVEYMNAQIVLNKNKACGLEQPNRNSVSRKVDNQFCLLLACHESGLVFHDGSNMHLTPGSVCHSVRRLENACNGGVIRNCFYFLYSGMSSLSYGLPVIFPWIIRWQLGCNRHFSATGFSVNTFTNKYSQASLIRNILLTPPHPLDYAVGLVSSFIFHFHSSQSMHQSTTSFKCVASAPGRFYVTILSVICVNSKLGFST